MFAFDASGSQPQARAGGLRPAVPISSMGVDPVAIPSTTVTSIVREASTECGSSLPSATGVTGFQNGLRMLVDAHTATAATKTTTAMTGASGASTCSGAASANLSHMGVPKLSPVASGGRCQANPAVAADIAGGVAGGMVAQEGSRDVSPKIEFTMPVADSPQREAQEQEQGFEVEGEAAPIEEADRDHEGVKNSTTSRGEGTDTEKSRWA